MSSSIPPTRSNLAAPPLSPMRRSISLGSQSSPDYNNVGSYVSAHTDSETIRGTSKRASLLGLSDESGSAPTLGSTGGSHSGGLAAGGPMAPGIPGGAKSTSRARDLLRKHYNLGIGPPPPSKLDSSGRAVSSDPMDLNSPAFDAKSYYEQLITTSSLPMLLKQENELLSEIRQLDSERQSLVYNHHHELIAASDTIGAVKTHAETLDSSLDLLRVAFSEISRLSAEVSEAGGSIKPRRIVET